MKTKIFNYHRLAEEEINDKVIRVKAIMINSKNEVLFAESYGTLQFPGGHVEEKEDLSSALRREVNEETGINLQDIPEPFYTIKYFMKDYPERHHNRSIEIYYYKINTDTMYDLKNLKLDEYEKVGNFTLQYIPFDQIKKTLKANLHKNKINKIINREIMLALKELNRK